MTTLRALIYADARSLVNFARAVRRSPARAIMWAIFGVLFAAFAVARGMRAAHRQSAVSMLPSLLSSDVIVCSSIVMFGVALTFGGRYAGLFAHPAEARFIVGSPAPPFIATLYVQGREVVRGSARLGLGVLYGAIFYLPQRLNPGTLARDVIAIVLAALAITAAPLARQLATEPFATLAGVAGWIFMVAGTVPLVRDGVAAFHPPGPIPAAILRLPEWHPAGLMLAAPAAGYAVIASPLLLTAVLILIVARRAHDAYPELYELSMRRLQRTEQLRRRFYASTTATAPQNVRIRRLVVTAAPPGAAIFVWRAWTEYRHTNSLRSTALETAGLLFAGFAFARLTAGADPRTVAVVGSSFGNVLFLLALARSAVLASELRRPLFWFSAPLLFERLGALALAQSWRFAAWFVLFAIGLGIGQAPVAGILASALIAPAALLLAVATGYATYGLLPSDADQRGPMMVVRWLIGYVLLVPLLTVGIVVGIVARSAILGVTACAMTALLEAAALIAFAAWRIERISIPLR